MSWTKKHDKFARACRFTQSMEHLARWQLRRAKLNETTEIEIDLHQFNAEIAKDRDKGGYHRKTLSVALSRLDSESGGMFTIIKSYSPWVHKVLIRPLSFLAKLKSAKSGLAPKPKTANPMFSAKHKKRAKELLLQNISKLDSLLRSVGMNCNQETLHRMWRYADRKMSNVQEAVEYMLCTHKEKLERTTVSNFNSYGEPDIDMGKGITSPIGWLHDCLKYFWHINHEQEIELPYFDSISAISNFVKGIMPDKSLIPDSRLLQQKKLGYPQNN